MGQLGIVVFNTDPDSRREHALSLVLKRLGSFYLQRFLQ